MEDRPVIQVNMNPRRDPRDRPGRYRPKRNLADMLDNSRGATSGLAHALGVSAGTVSDWKSGKRLMSNEHVIMAAGHLRVNMLYLLDLIDDRTQDYQLTEETDILELYARRGRLIDYMQAKATSIDDDLAYKLDNRPGDYRDLPTLASDAIRASLDMGVKVEATQNERYAAGYTELEYPGEYAHTLLYALAGD